MRPTAPAVLSGCLFGVMLAVLAHGFLHGVLWMRIVGLATTSLTLLALSWAAELSATTRRTPPGLHVLTTGLLAGAVLTWTLSR